MFLDELVRHRRALHRIPEIKFALPKTQAYILDALKEFDCEIETAAETGVLAYFDAGKTETMAFRADMDALPVMENTGRDFASEHPGCMHACGHDGHMAMLLVFARWVNENISRLSRNVLLIFQPSEESGGGGGKIVESGKLEKYGIVRFFAIHVEPSLPVGCVATRPGPFMARASEIHLNISGKAGHAAVPGAGCDALAAAVDFVHGTYEADRTLHKTEMRRIKFCTLQSGNSMNVVADSARVVGSIRTFAPEDYDIMKDSMTRLAEKAEEDYGVKCELDVWDGYPAVLNDRELYEKACGMMDIKYIEMPSFLGEDFAYYRQIAPILMFRVGLGTGIPLHAATFDFDEKALETGVELFIKLTEME